MKYNFPVRRGELKVESEVGFVPSTWSVKKLSETSIEIIDGDRGVNYPKQSEFEKKGYCLFLSAKNVTIDGFDFNDNVFISRERDQKLNKGKLQRHDIVITTRGTVGNIAKYGDQVAYDNLRINSGMVIIRNKSNEFNSDFLYWLLRSPIIKQQFTAIVSGSAQPQLPIRDLKYVNLPVPPAKDQEFIATLLGSLSSKMTLNRRMNKTLESIAQAIFKHWFIDFEFPDENGQPYKSSGGEMVDTEIGDIPKGWTLGKLSDILVNTKNNLQQRGEILKRKYVPIDCLSKNSLCIASYEPSESAKSSLIGFEKDDILVGAMRVYFHRVNLAPFSGVTRTTSFVLRAKEPYFLSFAILLMNLDSTIDYANSHSKGTTMPYAAWDGSLELMPIVVPDYPVLSSFHNIAYTILSKIREGIFIRENLSSIRDLLLPKLISGKIRVPLEDTNV